MLVDDFMAFTEGRPDGEKWELIDGDVLLNLPPDLLHQRIVANLICRLADAERALHADWEVIPGIAVRIGDHRAPTPDVMVHRFGDFQGNICDDLTVAFEVSSGSTAKRDLGWKLDAYPRLASAQSYVVVVPDQVSVLVFQRNNDWREHGLRLLDDVVQLPELRVELALRDIYAGVPC